MVSPGDLPDLEVEPREGDRAVANLLALGLGAPRWSVCYIDSFDGQMREHDGAVDTKLAGWVMDAFTVVLEAQKKGAGPKCPIEHSHRKMTGACTCSTSKVPT